ncbi:hypothetical protein [Stutzerimonas kunmingensis]|uniref:hypothetical protein n=1 Tax=Stutzerimonas kunmingensis TaxID=1211807 RepID=UPI00241FE1B7|nr:hypothetical protein [Stutzerimonas kunmingensis]
MSLWDDLKQKAMQANPEMAEKAAQTFNRAKEVALEASQKAAPVLKEATERTSAFAKEKTPIVKAQALKAFEDAKARRAQLQERAKHDRVAREEMIRTMYDIALSPTDENFLEEGFRHFHHELRFFALTGQVLDTQKRANTHLSASHSHSASNGGYIYGGYGSMGGNAHSSMRISSYVTTEHEFWIRLGDGSEACFGFADSSIQMRTGQWLTMVFVRPMESTDGLLCAIYNHASNSYQGVMPPTAINSRFGLYIEQPGFFNKKEVMTTQRRLLTELDRRLTQIGQHVAIYNQVPSQ